MRQFFLDTTGGLPRPGDEVTLDAEESHHLFTVLRGGRQTRLHLVDGRGHRLVAEFRDRAGRGGKLAGLRVVDIRRDEDELAVPRLVLACAVVKGRRFEWLLEKAVEIGVHHLWPLASERGVVEPGAGRRQRWQHILQAALKQSGRALLPELAEPCPLADCLDRLAGVPAYYGAAPAGDEDDDGGMGAEGGETIGDETASDETAGHETAGDETAGDEVTPRLWTDLLSARPEPLPERLAVLIGPEGGWSAGENGQLRAAGLAPLDLGPHVLRTETAAVAGVLALQGLRRAWRRV